MFYSALSWVLLSALPGGSDDGLPRGLAADETADVADVGFPLAGPDDADTARSVAATFDEMQNPPPPPQNPPPPPPPPQKEVTVVPEPPSPVTLSLNGRIPFPLGSVRFGSFAGGTTTNGERVRYDDIFMVHGYGGGAELAFLNSDFEPSDAEPRDKDGHPKEPVPAVARHASGFYLSGAFDTIQGDTFSISAGTLKVDRLNDESMFIGYKSHNPWGDGRFFTEFRVGGGAIHYSNVQATLTTGGTSTGVQLFRDTWAPAAEVEARLGIQLGRLTLYIGGEGFAAEGPREGKGLPFTVNSNTFFTASAEAGIMLGF